MSRKIGSQAVNNDTGANTKAVMLSVIVPVYNAAHDLNRCLAALAASDWDDFEVVVVDDGSTVPIEPVVKAYLFSYLRIDGPGGPARARNRGVAQSHGTYVAFVDADVCIHSDALGRIAQRLETDSTIDAVIGTYDDSPAAPGFLSQYKNLFHHYIHKDSEGDVSTFWSGCGAMRREAFDAFGGFDETRYTRPAIEDIELGTWMSVSGRRIVLDQTIRCKHLKRWTFWNLLKTDVFDRGIPWTRLMLRAGTIPGTLNVKPAQRASVAFVYLAMAFLVAGFRFPLVWIAAMASAAAVTLLNVDFYRYFYARRGLTFVLAAAPLHWLYFIYCGISVTLGTVLYFARPESSPAKPSGFDPGQKRQK